MNQNDLDRYTWCTGQPWSASVRPAKTSSLRSKTGVRAIFLVGICFFMTLLALILLR
jgi:hypothetical protein